MLFLAALQPASSIPVLKRRVLRSRRINRRSLFKRIVIPGKRKCVFRDFTAAGDAERDFSALLKKWFLPGDGSQHDQREKHTAVGKKIAITGVKRFLGTRKKFVR